MQSKTDLGGEPRGGGDVKAQFYFGIEFVDVLASRSGGAYEVEFELVFGYGDYFGYLPLVVGGEVPSLIVVIVAAWWFGRFVGSVHPRRLYRAG